MKNNLVIGLGQIGTAIQKILECDGTDADLSGVKDKYDVIHICFPYTTDFKMYVKLYQERFQPSLTIIHSTVPLGTSSELGAVHSPCRGIHPDLEEGIRTFVKFFGGKQAREAARIFAEKGINCQMTEKAEETEAMKLWDTTIYGWNIMLEKEIYNYCKKHNLDFDLVYTKANRTYNEGYEELGHPEYKKYILSQKDGPIGGHCVVSNLSLLKGQIPDIIYDYNSKL